MFTSGLFVNSDFQCSRLTWKKMYFLKHFLALAFKACTDQYEICCDIWPYPSENTYAKNNLNGFLWETRGTKLKGDLKVKLVTIIVCVFLPWFSHNIVFRCKLIASLYQGRHRFSAWDSRGTARPFCFLSHFISKHNIS